MNIVERIYVKVLNSGMEFSIRRSKTKEKPFHDSSSSVFDFIWSNGTYAFL